MSTPGFFHDMLAAERDRFRNVVAAVLDGGLDYRPDPKARCSRDLIGHLLGHNLDLVELLEDGVIHHRNQVPFDSLAAAAKEFDGSFTILLAKLSEADDQQWTAPGKFYVGERMILEAPVGQIAWMLFLDSIHHRGQLSTYLRPMGSKVPSIYGPSADDQGDAH